MCATLVHCDTDNRHNTSGTRSILGQLYLVENGSVDTYSDHLPGAH